MQKDSSLFNFFRYAAIFGDLLFILWILYNGINEGFKGTLYQIVSYIGLILLLILNALLLYGSGK
jgi:hypothetical protein